jgi:hypothetical protein
VRTLAFQIWSRWVPAAAALLTLLVFQLCERDATAGRSLNAAFGEQANGAAKVKSLRGRVIDDAGRPLAGAFVTLMPAGAVTDSTNERQVVRTDENGAFSFEAIADRPYTITVLGFEDPGAGQYHLPGENMTIRVERGGVITGRVTNADGEPLVGVPVLAKCVAAKDGKPLLAAHDSYEFSRSRMTDDRGIYRFWDLRPGAYIVSAGPAAFGFRGGAVTAYDDDSPTYYPSSTLGSATRIVVNSGQELTGIDISYRGYKGHPVSGTATGNIPPSHLQIYLATPSGDYLDSIWAEAEQSSGSFEFARVSDGDYLLMATLTSGNEVVAISPPRSVTMKGADVTGINLKPVPLGGLSGRITLEYDPTLDCKNKANNTLAETVLSLRRNGSTGRHYPLFMERDLTYTASPDAKGQFVMKRVPAGDYRIESWLPNEDWYVAAIDLGAPAIGASGTTASATGRSTTAVTAPGTTARGQIAQRTDLASRGLAIHEGQTVSGLNVVIKNGAAGLSGRVIARAAAAALPTHMRVHLMPAEPSRAAERLRFFEAEAGGDGSFKFKNLAPGSYRVMVRAVEEEDSTQPVADTVGGRTKLLREAGEKAPVIELHPCERRTDCVLKLSN